MKFENFSVEISEQPEKSVDVCKWLERIGRVCWKSEDKITSDSYKRFLKMIFEKGHFSVFEHAWFSFYDECYNYYRFSFQDDELETHLNLRTCIDANFNKNKHIPIGFFIFQKEAGLDLIKCPYEIETDDYYEGFDTSKQKITLHIVCNRGISHQLVRHRDFFSYSQESTRYVNFSKKDGVTYIKPLNFDDWHIDEQEQYYKECKWNEIAYLDAIDRGRKPEEARNYLSHYLRTELYMTAPIFGWKHYIQERRKGGQAEHQIICDLLEEKINDGLSV